ncbi:olfactory receptor 1468-like [Engystomops pustulosus]|uniref:olfactory receptor 1468-like n=1 Tax=Engystomops pustulosus TaxID=76066 RepID=UPI003AFADFAC
MIIVILVIINKEKMESIYKKPEEKSFQRNMKLYNQNLTVGAEFFLLGFQGSQRLRNLLFVLFLVVFFATICGNLLIITLVSSSRSLHTPMYFFISQLSISDIIVITNIVPNLLHILLHNGGTIHFGGCMSQFYFFTVLEAFECLLLTAMSYDRYVAICNPLRYSSIITIKLCVELAAMSWVLGAFVSFIVTITQSYLHFCGRNTIDHLFCDIDPLLELACSDTFIIHLEIYLMGIPIVLIPTIIIVVSYTNIVLAVLRIPSSTGRQKAFSTCSSHLIVVSIFYGTLFSVYVFPKIGETWVVNKILSLFYTVFTPLVNPIIYSLRNQDIKKAAQETFHKKLEWKGRRMMSYCLPTIRRTADEKKCISQKIVIVGTHDPTGYQICDVQVFTEGSQRPQITGIRNLNNRRIRRNQKPTDKEPEKI